MRKGGSHNVTGAALNTDGPASPALGSKRFMGDQEFTAVSRRVALAGFAGMAALSGLACQPVAGSERSVELPDFRQRGDVDDNAAFRRALAASLHIHFPAGKGTAADGAYLLSATDKDNLPSQLELSGDGADKSVIRRSYHSGSGPFILHVDSGSADPARNVAGLVIHDLAFEDEVQERGFSEFDYLVMLNGVSDVLLRKLRFTGFRGDALHFGSSTVSHVERHNRRIEVRGCVFDGVNSNNRNAISVIDGDGLLIENCHFINCSRTGDGGRSAPDPMNPETGISMPGPIDLEPNQDDFAIVRNIAIRSNVFTGGGGQAVNLNLLPDFFVGTAQSGIVIEGNQIANRWGAFGVQAGANPDGKDARSNAITFAGNEVSNCNKPFIVDGLRGFVMRGNSFTDCASMAELGYVNGNRDVVITDNIFERLGETEGGYGLWIRTVQNLTLVNNQFVDIGLRNGTFGIAIALVDGAMQQVRISGNRFASPRGRMKEALTVFRDAAPRRASFVVQSNVMAFSAPNILRALGL